MKHVKFIYEGKPVPRNGRSVLSRFHCVCVYKYHFADLVHHVFLWIRPQRKVQNSQAFKVHEKICQMCHQKQAHNSQIDIYNNLHRDNLKTTGGYAVHYALERVSDILCKGILLPSLNNHIQLFIEF
jgi:hypothetical protein